ncbi:MAG: DUF2490 domain-containing protein [Flavobacteriales bacterium]|nr:DUF2490 domain-containing protein [Bacteroidota bacterium]MCB9241389.1 DUF2490 domain-containing protein [Flavobacteriales bacterium]
MLSPRSLLLIALMMGLFSPSFAQRDVADQTCGWYVLMGNHRLSNHWGIRTEYQFRRYGLISDWQQSLLRFGADYHFSESTGVTAGYAWIVTFPYGEQPVLHQSNEHRIWEQFLTTQRFGKMQLQHRYWLEQRFLDTYVRNVDGSISKSDGRFRQRARYRAMLSRPLKEWENDRQLFAAVNDEVLINFGPGTGKNILSQNRTYVGLGYQYAKGKNIMLGYLNQLIFKSDGIRMEQNHTLHVFLRYNVDFRKSGG